MLKTVNGLKNAVLVLIIVGAGHILLPAGGAPRPPPGTGLRVSAPVFSRHGAGRRPPGSRRPPGRISANPGLCAPGDHPSAPACDGGVVRGASLRVLPEGGRREPADSELASAEELYHFALGSKQGSPPQVLPADLRSEPPACPPPAEGGWPSDVQGAFEDMSCPWGAPCAV